MHSTSRRTSDSTLMQPRRSVGWFLHATALQVSMTRGDWLSGEHLQPALVVNVHNASGLPHRLAPHAAGDQADGQQAMLQPCVELHFQVRSPV